MNVVDDLTTLQQPTRGIATLTPHGILTIGTHRDGVAARLNIGTPTQARHTTILGDTRSGKSTLLRSILIGARTAGIICHAISYQDRVMNGMVAGSAYSLATLNDVLDEATGRLTSRRTDWPMRLLVIDNLHALDPDQRILFANVVSVAAKAGIAIVVSTPVIKTDLFADADTQRLMTTNLIRLRPGDVQPPNGWSRVPAVPGAFANGTFTTGVGYLNNYAVPFRARMPR